jgi:hypothetical protein
VCVIVGAMCDLCSPAVGIVPGLGTHTLDNLSRLGVSLLHRVEDVAVSRIGDGHNGAAEELTAGSAEEVVVASKVVHVSLGEHGVVLELRAAEGRAVARDDDELGIALRERNVNPPRGGGGARGEPTHRADGLDGLLVSHSELARLDNKLDARVDSLLVLLLQATSIRTGVRAPPTQRGVQLLKGTHDLGGHLRRQHKRGEAGECYDTETGRFAAGSGQEAPQGSTPRETTVQYAPSTHSDT